MTTSMASAGIDLKCLETVEDEDRSAGEPYFFGFGKRLGPFCLCRYSPESR
jgi:hypothetical protein